MGRRCVGGDRAVSGPVGMSSPPPIEPLVPRAASPSQAVERSVVDRAVGTVLSRKRGQEVSVRTTSFRPQDIRNIALLGHAGSGKTMLSEAILHRCGAITRLGSVE